MKIETVDIKTSRQPCVVKDCHRDGSRTLTYQGRVITVCGVCYVIIMDKLAAQLKKSNGGTRRKH